MRFLALLLLAVCFVSVSALAGYEKVSAGNLVDVKVISASQAQLTIGEVSASTSGPASDERAESRKDECSCKQKSGSLAFVCGVTLALFNEDQGGCFPVIEQAWFAIGQNDRDAQLMYLLKRPPRNILQS